MKRFAIGLRLQVIILSSFLLLLPLLGYQYVWEMEKFLRQGQEQTLLGTTRAVATALHERPKLFNEQASFLSNVQAGKDLYAYDLETAIKIDGQLSDWTAMEDRSFLYNQDYVRYQTDKNSDNPISFRHMVGKRDGYLYGYLQVTDKKPVFRKKNTQRLDQNDHLIIALTDPQGELQQYIISVQQSGWFNAYTKTTADNSPLKREKRLQGFWQLTDTGYNIEFRFPLEMLGNKLGFALHTVSNTDNRRIDNIIATSNTRDVEQLGTVLIPSPEIQRIINGMSHTQSRIWVVDRHQRVLAKAGDIHQSTGVLHNSQQQNQTDSFWDNLHAQFLTPLYSLFMTQPSDEFIDNLDGSTQLNSEFITQALNGETRSSWHFTDDDKAMIISAAHPIMVGNKVMGIVVAEETTNGILSLRNTALEKLLTVVISIIFITTILLLIFASTIARRIRKLRDQADIAIDVHGKISSPFTPSQSKDEIGDLSRGLSDMVNRLGQYHHYLENLSSRLSHELRTPVAVVRSSLENLSLMPQSSDNKKYIERADKGIKQLNKILTSMSEATRIEQSLQCSEKQIIAFNELVEACVQGYQMTYNNYRFELLNNKFDKGLNINVDPDFIVQLFDKLISNAMEFSEPQNNIEISLNQTSNYAELRVSNKGPLLAKNMDAELFNSMVSVRPKEQQDKTHLGLGLFIAKMITEFHQGNISIRNRSDNLGVEVLVKLPLS